MSVRLKAIYRDGAFVPVPNGERLNVPENAEVDLTVHEPYRLSPTPKSTDEREHALRDLFASWDTHPVSADAPPLTREEMHERS